MIIIVRFITEFIARPLLKNTVVSLILAGINFYGLTENLSFKVTKFRGQQYIT